MSTDWEDIRRRCVPEMWSIAWRILKHDSDALDCCQDVFSEAFQRTNDPSKKPIENWEAFLNWLTTRRAIDLLRKRNRKSQPTLLGELDVLMSDPTSTDRSTLDGTELTEWVRQQLAEMKGQMAECFWLCCVDQMSYSDVADQLGITSNLVGVNVHRAREFLRERLARHQVTERKEISP